MLNNICKTVAKPVERAKSPIIIHVQKIVNNHAVRRYVSILTIVLFFVSTKFPRRCGKAVIEVDHYIVIHVSLPIPQHGDYLMHKHFLLRRLALSSKDQ